MDIAVIGPEKFAFQDMATIDVALRYRAFGPFSLIPEKSGGEDANLEWTDGSGQTLEVQVKGAAGTVGVAELVAYLTHYPSRRAKGSLIERLMDDPGCHALFVLSARCKDEMSELLVEGPVLGKPATRPVAGTLVSALRNEVSRQSAAKPPKKASNLALERLNDMGALSRRPLSDFESALAKIGLVEKETAETIEVRLHSALRAERFDTLAIRGILARLTDLLAEAKRSQMDAFGPMLAELTLRAPTTLKPIGYLDRGIEPALEKALLQSSLLALVGPPRAGKSWTAKAIAGRLQEVGFEVRQGGQVDEAERFLTDAVGAERLYVLDDPLGSREPVPDANARLAALSALAAKIPGNRRLIVAQSEHVLLQTTGMQSLANHRLGGKPWTRLEPLSAERAKGVWEAAANDQGLAAEVIARVNGLIETDPNMRDPGALSYLAQTWIELHALPLDEEIRLQASRDASDFARALATQVRGAREVLTASALATSASIGVADGELAFIIDGGSDRPGLAGEFSVYTVGDDDPKPPPVYDTPRTIGEVRGQALDTLWRRRVVERIDSRFNFTHPYLRAGAQTLTTPEIETDSELIVEQTERAIACVSPATSLAASRNLRWLRLALGAGYQSRVFEIAETGLRSLFPATRDSCFEFLLELIDQLPQKTRDRVPIWSRRVSIDLGDIDVRSGVAFISSQPDWFHEPAPLAEVQPYLDAIERGEIIALDISLSKRLLLALATEPAALGAATVRRFLRADEAVIRAAAARTWSQIDRHDDGDILDRIRSDGAPAVGAAVLQALVDGWRELPPNRRDIMISIVRDHARSAGTASTLFTRLVRFGREDDYGGEPPWMVFGAIMPAVIDNLPISVSFSDGRLPLSVEQAIAALSPTEVLPTLKSWAKRVLARLDRFILSEFELAIVDPLLDVAPENERLPILRDLFAVQDTGARVVMTKWLSARWDELAEEERDLLRDALSEPRNDVRWLRATVLTLAAPPGELVEHLTGAPRTLQGEPADVERALGSDLFAACAHMFMGWPQPLWWYATHHSSNGDWKRLIRLLARSPNHPLHAAAFYEVANFDSEELADVIAGLPDDQLEKAFRRLLDFKIARVGDWRSRAWATLFVRAKQLGLLDRFLAEIEPVLEGILEWVSDIRPWLGKGDLSARVLSMLPDDVNALMKLRDLASVNQAMQEQVGELAGVMQERSRLIFGGMCAKLLAEISLEPPRIHGTWSEIEDTFRRLNASPETLAQVAVLRLASLDAHKAVQDRFAGEPAAVVLEGWIDQGRLVSPA
ncbi:hypothetical protein N7E70_025200 [Aminobacter sp. NyZ550]|uniref:hypothetical protein n=1 Tax=Aminobacter sp. NyZ550 TaxID=2979870 RepID=UPI0021D60C73|nr:hypothetical protein [Aminobacter sp. NyZ550]WAX94911.1 hypothetical protein N7E70_025200 [Aminobacter sp. NyZ550]